MIEQESCKDWSQQQHLQQHKRGMCRVRKNSFPLRDLAIVEEGIGQCLRQLHSYYFSGGSVSLKCTPKANHKVCEGTGALPHLRAIANAYSATTVFPADVWAATSTEWPAGTHKSLAQCVLGMHTVLHGVLLRALSGLQASTKALHSVLWARTVLH
eukprot:1159000-Pelagomonas_calceolata.AAC.1